LKTKIVLLIEQLHMKVIHHRWSGGVDPNALFAMSHNDRRSSLKRAGARKPAGLPARGGMSLPRWLAPPRAVDLSCRGGGSRSDLGSEQFSGLIGEVYAAALDPTLWPSVLPKANQFVEGAAALVPQHPTSKDGCGGGEGDDVARPEERNTSEPSALQRSRLIAQHLNRASSIERECAKAAALEDLFNHFRSAIFLLAPTAGILHANAAGRRMLAQGSVLRSASGRLAATETDAARALQNPVEAAIAKPGPDPLGSAFTLRGRDGQRYVGQVLPLSATARRQEVSAIVLVSKVAFEPPPIGQAIAETFDLTATEVRVLLASVEWSGVAEVAAALGVGRATVKTHLHRLFRKTGTSCQAELVKLVAGFSRNLVG
jgi:DNA-binding CsgD family transcriptional regulator